MAINGTSDNDTLPGTVEDDTINGLGGKDSLLGFDGNDLLSGGDDDDTLDGGEFHDTLDGGNGNDVLAGGIGDDWVQGGLAGSDTLLGGEGSDYFNSGLGSDSIDGGSGFDTVSYSDNALAGSIHADLVQGRIAFSGGTDTVVGVEHVFGGSQADTLTGNDVYNLFFTYAGDDLVDGGRGPDSLYMGQGQDSLTGGLGNDFLSGEAGFDSAYFLDRSLGDVTITVGASITASRNPFTDVGGRVLGGGEDDEYYQLEHLIFADGSYTPVPMIQVSNGFLKEGSAGSAQMEFLVHLTSPTTTDVTVSVRTVNGSAVAGSDYTAIDTTVVVSAFQQDVSFFVPIHGDGDVEGTETFQVEISDPQGAVFAGGLSSLLRDGIILSDEGDLSPTDDFGNDTTTGTTLDAGSSLRGTVEVNGDLDTFRINLVAGQEYHLSVEGRATDQGSLPDTYLNLLDAAGTVLAFNDDSGQGYNSFISFTPESSGLFFFQAKGFGSNTGTYLARLDLASSLPELSIEDFSVVEGDSGGLIARVNVRSSRVFDETMSVTVTPASGTAIAGSDFDATPVVVSIFPGSNIGTASIPIVTDALSEHDETFTVTLSNPTKAVLAPDTDGTVAILDDDLTQVTISGASVGEGSGSVLFTLGVAGLPSTTPLVVTYQVISGSAVAGTDFTNTAGGTVTIPAGQASLALPVFPLADALFEGDQILYAAISSVGGSASAEVGAAAVARATILDDDPVPNVAVNGVASVGGAGIDVIGGGPLRDSLVGDGGNDVLLGGQEADRLEGGGGDDFLLADLLLTDLGATAGGADAVLGGAGRDSVLAGAGNDTVTGDGDDDLLVGQGGRDLLVGGDGPDALYGGDQADSLKGGNGDDFLFGESAPDTMDGGADNDRIYVDIDDFLADGNTGSFDAVVLTGPGSWVIDLGSGVNQNVGAAGPRLLGFEVVDAAVAASAVNVTGFSATGAGNVLYGSAFNDTITGSSAADIILGGDGDDLIAGGAGGDSIGSEKGDDTLTGGIGPDVFIYFDGEGSGDVIVTDFEADRDELVFLPHTAATEAGALALATQSGGDVVFTLGSGRTITLAGVQLDSLDTGDLRILGG